MPWDGSTRRDGLPSWWPSTRRRILDRDPVCKCEGCVRCLWPHHGYPWRCDRASAEVDHIGDRDNHKDTNLRGLCTSCHALRSSQQGNAAKADRARPGTQFGQPPEPHPGRL